MSQTFYLGDIQDQPGGLNKAMWFDLNRFKQSHYVAGDFSYLQRE